MPNDESILSFENVAIQDEVESLTRISVPQMDLFSGTLAALFANRDQQRLLADAATGLVPPERGRVYLKGTDWTSFRPDQAAEMRGRIGRVFSDRAWASNLDVDENILLGQRYHSSLSNQELVRKALQWAGAFGMEDLPRGRMTWIPEGLKQKSQWIRAFMAASDLLVLEDPTQHTREGDMERLTKAVREFCARGGVAVWMTSKSEVWNNPSLNADVKFKMMGAELKLES